MTELVVEGSTAAADDATTQEVVLAAAADANDAASHAGRDGCCNHQKAEQMSQKQCQLTFMMPDRLRGNNPMTCIIALRSIEKMNLGVLVHGLPSHEKPFQHL